MEAETRQMRLQAKEHKDFQKPPEAERAARQGPVEPSKNRLPLLTPLFQPPACRPENTFLMFQATKHVVPCCDS